jgi:hypothetical protein
MYGITVQDGMAIKRTRHRGLKRLYEADNARGLPAVQVKKIKRILAALDAVADLAQVATMPGGPSPAEGQPAGGIRNHRHRQLAGHLPAGAGRVQRRQLRRLPLALPWDVLFR